MARSQGALDDLSDAELIVVSVLDPEAFCVLYDRWAAPLLAFIFRRVCNPEVAADLLAETFATVFEKRSKFRDSGHPGSAWLYTIAGSQVARYYRRKRVELRAVERLGIAVPQLDDESLAAFERISDSDPGAGLLVSEAISQIPSGEREAVQLRVVEDLEYREIASRLNCSVVAARVRVHRGLARLTKLLEATP
jgi:RNA polymerase sigma-70 factor (ECF subfamily)